MSPCLITCYHHNVKHQRRKRQMVRHQHSTVAWFFVVRLSHIPMLTSLGYLNAGHGLSLHQINYKIAGLSLACRNSNLNILFHATLKFVTAELSKSLMFSTKVTHMANKPARKRWMMVCQWSYRSQHRIVSSLPCTNFQPYQLLNHRAW